MKSINLLSLLTLVTCNILLGQTTTSTYYFAHSLIWHEKNVNNQANIPYWLAEMEDAAGDVCLTSGKFAPGQFGASALPPTQTWSFYYVNDNHGSAMTPGGTYVAGTHQNVVLTYMNWEIVYDYGANIGDRIPATVSNATDSIGIIFNWFNTNDPGRNLYLYECWPKIETNIIMNGVAWDSDGTPLVGSPPNAAQWTEYTALALGHSNNFWKDLQDSMITVSGMSNVKLIPSSMICAKLWQPGGLLQDFTVTDLFVDQGPHGRPSAYFLAAMVVYAAQHGIAPTLPFSSHPQIDQRILDRFTQISDFIMAELTAFNFPNGSSRVWSSTLGVSSIPELESKLKVYPNPSSDHINIEYDKSLKISDYTLKITNTLGATVFTTAINKNTSYVDVKGCGGQGIYFVHIIDGEGKTKDVQKIVIK